MATVSASTARQTLPAQLDRVEAGEEVAITRHGRVVAVLVSPDQLRARRTTGAWEGADALSHRLEASRQEPLRPARMSAERVEELVKDVRAGRHGR